MPYPATFAGPQTRADWEAQNPYLPQFEFGQESDESLGVKVGPGYWNDLPYIAQSGVKVYQATLTQTSTAAPVATVIENTLGGTVVWTRTSAGIYVATLSGAFTPSKTTMFHKTTLVPDDISNVTYVASILDDANSFRLITGGIDTPADDCLDNFTFYTIVYP